jgi:2-phospho-L-lactate guanylyltransferase (CobY/MobA/RfbA family)
MDNITVITPPDVLYNRSKSILIVSPNQDLKNQLQDFLLQYPNPMNVYFCDPEIEVESIDWILKISKIADCVIIDIDNTTSLIKTFATYLISYPNVFYLTNDNFTPYNMVSTNRIYDLSWLPNFFKQEDNNG